MRKIVIYFLAVFTLLSESLAGGGWTQKKNQGFFKLSQYVIQADSYFNPEGNIIDVNPGISLYITSLYAEYGITDKLTTEVYFPFFSRSVLNAQQKRNGEFVDGEALNSVGDTDISFKYGLIQNKPMVVSAKLTLGLPLGEASGGESGVLQTGDGEFNQMVSIEASRSFYPIPFYTSAFIGINNRTNGFSDEFRFGFEAGYTLNKFTLVAKLAGRESLMNGDTNDNSTQGVFGNNIEYLSFTPEVIYSIKEKFGVSASVGTAFYGRQVLANPAFEGGFFLKL